MQSVHCPKGGLGNYEPDDWRLCQACDDKEVCEENTPTPTYQRARYVKVETPAYTQPIQQPRPPQNLGHVGSQLAQLLPERPMPVPGENPLERLGKNMLATMITALAREVANFWSQYNFPARTRIPVYEQKSEPVNKIDEEDKS